MARLGAERAVSIVLDYLRAQLPPVMAALSADAPAIGLAGKPTIELRDGSFYAHPLSPNVAVPAVSVYCQGERELPSNTSDIPETEHDIEIAAVVPYSAAATYALAEAAAYRLGQGIRAVLNADPRLGVGAVDHVTVDDTTYPRGSFGTSQDAIFVVVPLRVQYHPDRLPAE